MGETKVENYIKATERLNEALEEAGENPTELTRDGVIQRFEFCAELAWKSVRECLIDRGYAEMNGPKAVMREAYAYELISDETAWLDILKDRNLTSHIYDQEHAAAVFERIKTRYNTAFNELKDIYEKDM